MYKSLLVGEFAVLATLNVRISLLLLRQDAKRKFGLTSKDLKTVPSMTSVPRSYGSHYIDRKRVVLVDHLSAREAGIALHGSAEAMEAYASKVLKKKLKQYEERKRNWKPGHARPRKPKFQDETETMHTFSKRSQGVVKAPYFWDVQKRILTWGMYCAACVENRMYTEESHREHVKKFGRIIRKEGRRFVHIRAKGASGPRR